MEKPYGVQGVILIETTSNILDVLCEGNKAPERKIMTGEAVQEHGIRPSIRQDVKFRADYETLCSILREYAPTTARKFERMEVPEKTDDSHFDKPSGWMTMSLGSNHIDLKDEYAAAIKKRMADGGEIEVGIGVVGFSDVPGFLKDTGLRFDEEMPVYASKAKQVRYPVFIEENCCTVNVEQKGIGSIYVVNKNIPYEYFSRLPINQEAFSQNLSEGFPRLFGYTLEEATKSSLKEYMDEDIGFYIDVTNNALTMTGSTSEMIALASYYGYPTIPASLILLSDETDVLGRSRRWHNVSKEETNKACAPYIELL